MATALLSAPAPRHETPVSRPCTSSSSFLYRSVTSVNYPHMPKVLLCSSSSSSSSSVSVVEDEPPPPAPDAAATDGADTSGFSRGCKVCGIEELERGCNGEGRIQGGIATFPGFGWWPIKAYRPCPGFLASGGRYRRQGQTMDEVAFGRGEKRTPTNSGTISENNQSENQGGRKFKR